MHILLDLNKNMVELVQQVNGQCEIGRHQRVSLLNDLQGWIQFQQEWLLEYFILEISQIIPLWHHLKITNLIVLHQRHEQIDIVPTAVILVLDLVRKLVVSINLSTDLRLFY